MSPLKKGPDIKLPELKVPDFLVDLYWDLRDRHLLPLAAILIVAIVAAPIALSQSGGGSDSAATGAGAIATPSTVSTRSGLLVARSAPELREYRRRLSGSSPKDPFKQQYAQAEETSSGSTGSTTASETEPSTPTPTPETSAPPGTTETGGEGTPGPGNLTYFSYAIDVRVVPGGSQDGSTPAGAGKPTVRHNLPELTMFPSRETPAAIYMGSTKDGKKALMLISSDVDSIFGDAKCVLGSSSCELVAMEPGVPETFVYGGAGKTFKLELLKIDLVETDKLNRAPLGKPKKKSHQSSKSG